MLSKDTGPVKRELADTLKTVTGGGVDKMREGDVDSSLWPE